ncbi:phosphotransferase family protein [Ruania halotolerans]|uniref:phosphotransferase family protein n=1 Tax=Ruania halotolerans TaxID=2897773 RepID=UPI001E51E2EE|nr:aminoglycoside phosphotransferase family protein [Ruania halotolerans]UFU07688.1 aminoglycoside phosphotransferase family protein [Ruania halotolerans]
MNTEGSEGPEVRRRLTWTQLPDGVRHLITERTGAVRSATSQEGGYSPGMASVLETASGRVFVKVASANQNARSAELHRKEAAVSEVLRDVGEELPAPAFRWSVEVESGGDTWVVLAFDAADGPGPRIPWQAEELGEALELVGAVGRLRAPDHPEIGPVRELIFGEWHTVAADGEVRRRVLALDESGWLGARLDDLAALADQWPEAVDGTALVHHDLRADNMVRSGGRLLAVDWPYASRGAPWLDLLGMMPSMALEGGGDPEEVFTAHPVGAAADQDAVTVAIAALTGMFLERSVQAPPPGIPHVRSFQRDQGLVGVRWLRSRLG